MIHVPSLTGGAAGICRTQFVDPDSALRPVVGQARREDGLPGGDGAEADLGDDRAQLVVGAVLAETAKGIPSLLGEAGQKQLLGIACDLRRTGSHGGLEAVQRAYAEVSVRRGHHAWRKSLRSRNVCQ